MKRLFLFILSLVFLTSCEMATTPTVQTQIDESLISANVTESRQPFIYPLQYYTDKTRLESSTSASILSWRDLLNVGAITETKYSQEVSILNVQLGADIAALQLKYQATDIYGQITITFNIYNSNQSRANVIIQFLLHAVDGSETIVQTSSIYVSTGASVSSSQSFSTSGKKITSVTVSTVISK